jgi:hypothetical protein
MMADPGIEPQNPSRPGRTCPTNLARGTNASTTPIELENTQSAPIAPTHREAHAVSRRGTVRSRSGMSGHVLIWK